MGGPNGRRGGGSSGETTPSSGSPGGGGGGGGERLGWRLILEDAKEAQKSTREAVRPFEARQGRRQRRWGQGRGRRQRQVRKAVHLQRQVLLRRVRRRSRRQPSRQRAARARPRSTETPPTGLRRPDRASGVYSLRPIGRRNPANNYRHISYIFVHFYLPSYNSSEGFCLWKKSLMCAISKLGPNGLTGGVKLRFIHRATRTWHWHWHEAWPADDK